MLSPVLPPPPWSPPLPYTTLFRSRGDTVLDGFEQVLAHDQPPGRSILAGMSFTGELWTEMAPIYAAILRHPFLAGLTEDRKSTRLNSSHRCNSYAVFCLKKKNKKQ